MKKIISLILAMIIIVSAITTATALTSSEQIGITTDNNEPISTEEKILTTVDINDNFKDDEIIVALTNAESKNLSEYSVADFSEIPVQSVENLTKSTDDTLKVQRETESMAVQSVNSESTTDESNVYINEDKYHQFYLLKLSKPGKDNVIKCIKLLEQRDDIILAMPNYIDVIEPMEESIATMDETIASTYATTEKPNDYTGKTGQWGIDRIDLPEAWNIITGSTTLVVGVMDSGIYSSHEDLSANIAASSYHKNCTGDGTSALSDQGGHGTQVAGVIAAVENNGKGTVGACWNIKLASLKVFSYDSDTQKYTTSSSAFISAITHATTKGISILNYSAGGGGNSTEVLNALLDYNGLFICASGNESSEVTATNHYPASYNTDNMIVVAKGSDSTNDALASDSNYSSTYVDLSAPGVNILTTDNDSVNDYIITEGSSIAAPYVTGVAALLKSKYPAMSTSAIKYYITEKGVDKITALSGKVATGGRLNAYKALSSVKTFTIEYSSNGGTGSMADTEIIYKNSTPLRTNSFTKENYTFKGWNSYRKSDGKCYYTNGTTKKWFVEGSQDTGYTKYLYPDKAILTTSSSVDGDIITMTAQWAPNYTIHFNGNDASSGTMDDMSVVYGMPFYLTENTFKRGTDTMTHWYAKKGNLMYYTGASGSGWYTHGNQPSGYVRKAFTDGMYIIANSLSDITADDTITMNAYWQPSSGLLGDVNADDKITIQDATLIQSHLAKEIVLTAYQQKRADVNFSGSVTIKDSTMIQKYIAQEITEFGS